jgi:regulator of sirC expression with transglutaminase-like and TPR domain
MVVFCGTLVVLGLAIGLSDAEEPRGLSDAQLEQLANLSEEEIDLGEVALLLASEAYPDLDIPRYVAQLDRLAAEIRRFTDQMRSRTRSAAEPDYVIRAMNTYLYKRLGFHYDREDMYATQLKNRYLNGVLDTKAGSCTTLPLLYLALAKRLDYPVYPVAAPQHLFCRFRLPDGTYQNIEATAGGWSPDEDYIISMEIPQQGLKSGAYLENMTYRQLLGDLIIENGGYWARQGDFLRAVRYYELGLTLNPKAAEAYRMLGHACKQLAKEYHHMAIRLPSLANQPALELTRDIYVTNSRRYAEQSEEAFERADQLGAAAPTQANYWVRQNELRAAAQTASQPGGVP